MSRFLQSYLLLAVLVSTLASAQDLLSSAEAERVNRTFDSLSGHDSLKCAILSWAPVLDFAFRFDAGYIIRCPFSEFAGKDTGLATYARVTPKGGAPVVFGEMYRLPTPSPEMLAKIDPRRVKALLDMSGGFALGEGEYSVEVMAVDRFNRSCHKRWRVRAERSRGQRNLTVALEAGTVLPVWSSPWEGKLRQKGTGLRITVLLHAAPMSPRAAKLRAWDRAFLLESLTSLLRQIPCESVRLVAFNLDQQREVYREDQFDGRAFGELAHTLRNLEVGTVDYKALDRGPAGNTMLASLVNEQLVESESSDAVIFLGPTLRVSRKTPSEVLKTVRPAKPRFYYFEYFPWQGGDFADSIEHLTGALHGTTFRIHSPGEFGKGMQKLLRELKPANGSGVGDSEPGTATKK